MSRLRSAIILAISLGGTALAQNLPDYYPESFQRTGTVDDIGDDRIIINDSSFGLSDDVVVHSLFARETFVSTIRRGDLVGYLAAENRQIVEIWILPDNYDESANRR